MTSHSSDDRNETKLQTHTPRRVTNTFRADRTDARRSCSCGRRAPDLRAAEMRVLVLMTLVSACAALDPAALKEAT
ncbi:hypothetical protein M9458_019169, partial [Cirrhinus mrigala]